jgi:hypothetical protein
VHQYVVEDQDQEANVLEASNTIGDRVSSVVAIDTMSIPTAAIDSIATSSNALDTYMH